MSSPTQPQHLQRTQQRHPNWKPILLGSSPLLALVAALLLTSPVPHFRPAKPTSVPSPAPRPSCVRWMAPFFSGGGYSSEAWSYITALRAATDLRLQIDHHGDLENPEFWFGLPEAIQKLAIELHSTKCRMRSTIVVCHSEPGAWHPPLYATKPCPPPGPTPPMFVVGRTMFETDRLNTEHVKRCNKMDEVWVPTDFHVYTFINSGVEASKVVKMVQPVNVDFFDPAKHKASVLPTETPVLGSAGDPSKRRFVFLSIFKWERRKGWDVLLSSYLREFSAADDVALYLLVNAYHSDTDFSYQVTNFVRESNIEEPATGYAPVHVIDSHVQQTKLPALYKAADAFVLPSRGEGWGRPIVEAMAMELPVLATNWSGPTEYLTEENGYPVPVERMSEVAEGPFKGHMWAEPAAEELRKLMRRVVGDREEARRKGRRARKEMVERFSPEIVAELVVERIMEIKKKYDL